jgi:hypothetical protein
MRNDFSPRLPQFPRHRVTIHFWVRALEYIRMMDESPETTLPLMLEDLAGTYWDRPASFGHRRAPELSGVGRALGAVWAMGCRSGPRFRRGRVSVDAELPGLATLAPHDEATRARFERMLKPNSWKARSLVLWDLARLPYGLGILAFASALIPCYSLGFKSIDTGPAANSPSLSSNPIPSKHLTPSQRTTIDQASPGASSVWPGENVQLAYDFHSVMTNPTRDQGFVHFITFLLPTPTTQRSGDTIIRTVQVPRLAHLRPGPH